MEKTSIPLEVNSNGKYYVGWATPSDKKHPDGYASSYHVVLDQVFFGNVTHDGEKWLVDEQRPHDLIVAVGQSLERTLKQGGRL